MYKFWYDNVKPKYGEKAKLCYMDTNIFIAYVETDDIYKDIMEDVETRFGTSNFEIERPLTKEKSKRVIGLMKDQLGEQFIKELDGLRTKACSYLKDSNDKDKKAKDTKKCAIKTKLKFQDYKNCLEAAQT